MRAPVFCATCDMPVVDAPAGLICPNCRVGVYLPHHDYARPPATILRDWIQDRGDDDEPESDELVPAA